MQQYFTLEEAASKLQMSPDELREMAKKKQIRAFQDRGSWRFRAQDIDELARTRGLGSDADLPLGDVARAGQKAKQDDLLPADFNLDEEVPIGREKPAGSGSKSGSKSGSRSPAPRSAEDSPVRLVMEDDALAEPSGSKSGPRSKSKVSDSDARKAAAERPNDSDVRMVPDQRDPGGSGKMKSPSDSDIRLHELPSSGGKKKDSNVITEEIDLDAEEAKLKQQPRPTGKPKVTKAAPNLPTSSPFELSETDAGANKPGAGKQTRAKKSTDSSSDFEMVAFDSTKSPKEDSGSGDIPLLEDDEEVSLGEVSVASGGNSGINLQDPADSGISLEEGGSDELEFELSLDAGSTPKPAKKADKDSSSEFELSLDDSSADGSSSSEFELSLDDSDSVHGKKTEQGSDSEFELTLDDEGGLAVDDEAKDIFEETTFDVPALEDDSGSEAVALDDSATDLSASDFEISLDDDSDSGDRAGSQVVSLEDEEEADDAAGTVVKPAKKRGKSKMAPAALDDEPVLEDDEGLDLDVGRPGRRARLEEEEEIEEEEAEPVAAAPAEWGPMPAILLFPTVIVLFVVGLMSFELVQSMWGYHKPTRVGKPLIHGIAKTLIDESLPAD